jgi:hypothetical protein
MTWTCKLNGNFQRFLTADLHQCTPGTPLELGTIPIHFACRSHRILWFLFCMFRVIWMNKTWRFIASDLVPSGCVAKINIPCPWPWPWPLYLCCWLDEPSLLKSLSQCSMDGPGIHDYFWLDSIHINTLCEVADRQALGCKHLFSRTILSSKLPDLSVFIYWDPVPLSKLPEKVEVLVDSSRRGIGPAFKSIPNWQICRIQSVQFLVFHSLGSQCPTVSCRIHY